MKILLLHNFYKHRGGEDNVVLTECSLLKEMGNIVSTFYAENKSIRSFKQKLDAALYSTYSEKSKISLRKKIKEFLPDIVHVHNFFPLLTPSVYDAIRIEGIPVVQTLHNYRIICPNAMFLRNGRVCEDCLTGTSYNSVLHGCYRNSIIGSLAVATMVETHRKRQTWQKKVNRFIALTEFARQKFIGAGLPEEKIEVKSNFISPDPGTRNGQGNYALFVGRISPEKGILTLLKAWKRIRKIPLKIVGDGPLVERTRRIVEFENINNIELLGYCDRIRVFKLLKEANFLIFPSEWYEGFPMTLVEAFACELPVVASRIGGIAEIVDDEVTGVHFEPGDPDDLADKIQWLLDHSDVCRRIGKNARGVFLEKYTAKKNYENLMNIYLKAIDENR